MITFHFWKAVSHRPPTLEPGYLVITDVWEFIRPLPVIEQRVTCHLLNRLVIHLANSPKRWSSMVLGNSSRDYWKTPPLKWSPSRYICTFKNNQFWLFLAPPADPVEFLWFKMAGTCVLHIVLRVSCWSRISRGYFRHQKSVLSKIAIFCCFWLKKGGR